MLLKRCQGLVESLVVAVAGRLLLLLPPEDGVGTFVDSDQRGRWAGKQGTNRFGGPRFLGW